MEFVFLCVCVTVRVCVWLWLCVCVYAGACTHAHVCVCMHVCVSHVPPCVPMYPYPFKQNHLNCICRRIQLMKKGGQLQQSHGGGRGRFLGLQYWYSRQRNRRNRGTHEPPLCDIPVNDFHNLSGYDNPGQVNEEHRGAEAQYETVGDLNLALQQEPNPGNRASEANQAQEAHIYDHLNRTGAGRENGVQRGMESAWPDNRTEQLSGGENSTQQVPSPGNQRSKASRTEGAQIYDHLGWTGTSGENGVQCGTESMRPGHSPDNRTQRTTRGETPVQARGSQNTPAAAAEERQPHPGSQAASEKHVTGKEDGGSAEGKPPAGQDAEKKEPNKKEKFVARVLDQTLESIISQREALAATPEFQGTEGQDSDASQPRDLLSASRNVNVPRGTLTGSKDSSNVSDNSRGSSSEENHDGRRHRRDKHSSKHHKDAGKVGMASEEDLYAFPKKRPPVSGGSDTRKTSRDDRDASLNPSKPDVAVWATNVESSA